MTSLLFIALYVISYSKKGSSGRVLFTETGNVITKKRGAICELRHLPADQPFAHLDNTGNIEIGLSSLLVVGLSTLDISDTLAIFQSFGKYAPVIQPLMIQVRGPAKWSATSFMNVVRI